MGFPNQGFQDQAEREVEAMGGGRPQSDPPPTQPDSPDPLRPDTEQPGLPTDPTNPATG